MLTDGRTDGLKTLCMLSALCCWWRHIYFIYLLFKSYKGTRKIMQKSTKKEEKTKKNIKKQTKKNKKTYKNI